MGKIAKNYWKSLISLNNERTLAAGPLRRNLPRPLRVFLLVMSNLRFPTAAVSRCKIICTPSYSLSEVFVVVDILDTVFFLMVFLPQLESLPVGPLQFIFSFLQIHGQAPPTEVVRIVCR